MNNTPSHYTPPHNTPSPRAANPSKPGNLTLQYVLGAALVFVLVVALFGLWRFGSRSNYTPEYAGGPRAQISQTAFDYGDVKNNSTVETVFTIKNVGDRQLYFPTEPVVTVVEGCCPPKAQITRSELDPGESTEVRLSFSMHEGMDGPHEFRVKVYSSDVVEPEQEVAVLSNWIP